MKSAPARASWTGCCSLIIINKRSAALHQHVSTPASLASTDPFLMQHNATNVAASSYGGSGCRWTNSIITAERQRGWGGDQSARVNSWDLENGCGRRRDAVVPQVRIDCPPITDRKAVYCARAPLKDSTRTFVMFTKFFFFCAKQWNINPKLHISRTTHVSMRKMCHNAPCDDIWQSNYSNGAARATTHL